MALATQADVEAALGRELSEAEELRAPGLLTRASALLIGWTGRDFEPAPFPEVVVAVTADMVARVLTASEVGLGNVEQQTAGPFTVRYTAGSTSSTVWLSKADKMMLKPYRLGGGLRSIQAVGERYVVVEDDI